MFGPRDMQRLRLGKACRWPQTDVPMHILGEKASVYMTTSYYYDTEVGAYGCHWGSRDGEHPSERNEKVSELCLF